MEWRLHALEEKTSDDLPFNEYWLAKTPTGEAKYFRQCRSGESFQSAKIGQNGSQKFVDVFGLIVPK